MPGARTIVGDGLSGLVWVLELTSAISSAHCLLAYRRAYLGLITKDWEKDPKWGFKLRGRKTCIGMGPYWRRSAAVLLDGTRSCHTHAEKW